MSNRCLTIYVLLFSVYTNLGEDAVVHALNETRVQVVVTSHELLPKFRLVNVLIRFRSPQKLISRGPGYPVKFGVQFQQ